MALDDNTTPRSDNAADQIAKLRAQVEMLMKERVTPALAQAADRAEHAMGAVRGQADVISGQVRENPLAAVLIGIGVGFVIGRLLR
jgi:ElaB/YqjD/DUF883 family membrane-anchored ribosome-binding protein